MTSQDTMMTVESPDGGIGRRSGLKIRRPRGREGSNPSPGTMIGRGPLVSGLLRSARSDMWWLASLGCSIRE